MLTRDESSGTGRYGALAAAPPAPPEAAAAPPGPVVERWLWDVDAEVEVVWSWEEGSVWFCEGAV